MTEPVNNVEIKMNNDDAIELWLFLRDAVEEDRLGKDSGKGGFIPIGADFKLLRCLTEIAVALDNYRADMKKSKKHPALSVV